MQQNLTEPYRKPQCISSSQQWLSKNPLISTRSEVDHLQVIFFFPSVFSDRHLHTT